MTKDHAVDIALLHLRDAHEFAPLLASYAQALKRGAPRRPDDFYAEHLLKLWGPGSTEIWSAS